MSNFLAVDTSSRYLTVAVKKGRKKVVRYLADCAMTHSTVLMDEIDKALDEAGLVLSDCDFFAAVTGPGSFTGIRIGVACIKGYAVALNKPAAGVTSFEMLSYNVNSESDYLIAIDAAHGNFYTCGYSSEGEQNLSPRCISGEEVAALGLPVFGFEELALPNYKKLNPKDCLYPAVCKLAEEGAGGGLHALYVKKSQAEEERLARLNAK